MIKEFANLGLQKIEPFNFLSHMKSGIFLNIINKCDSKIKEMTPTPPPKKDKPQNNKIIDLKDHIKKGAEKNK